MAGQQDLPIRESSVIDLSDNNNNKKVTKLEALTKEQKEQWGRHTERDNDSVYPPDWPYNSDRSKFTLKHDPVTHPKHYDLFDGEYQVRDLIRDRLTPEEWDGYIKGNMIKYHMRAEHKNGTEDYKKLMEYLKWFIEEDSTDV